jgi:DNA replication protein DnaC
MIAVFKTGYPFVYGSTISEDQTPKFLKEVAIGDVIVAGGTKYIDFIGIAQEKSQYIRDTISEEEEIDWLFNTHKIEASQDVQAIAILKKLEREDVVYIKVKWFPINCSKLCMPGQTIKSFHPLNAAGKKYIARILANNNIHDKEEIMDEYVKLLTAKKNIVLTGAPGTGKTYLARNIAKKLVGDGNYDTNVQFVQFHQSYDYTDFVEGLRPVKSLESNEIGFVLKNGIFKEFCKKAKDKSNEIFVFIIDEINRGEISKIFGELFFSIDPDYRGTNGKVLTRFRNIQSEDTLFDKELEYGTFYVPENVYIIGTMNDIDRSVDSFDFAMRRRFTWIEITAEESAVNMNLPDESTGRMHALNNAISTIEGLNHSYHIGAAYFIRLEDGDYESLWSYHVEPLWREYLRGTPDAAKELVVLLDAYSLKPAENGKEE